MTAATFPQVRSYAEVLKVDDSLGLVFGWGMICKEDGQEYVDLQGDHIPEREMLDASSEFMQNSRTMGVMHEAKAGSVVFAFPLTEEIAKSYGIATRRTGLMIAVKPDKETLAKFRSGELKGFSIGGEVVHKDFNEEDHPRDDSGKFSSSGGGGNGSRERASGSLYTQFAGLSSFDRNAEAKAYGAMRPDEISREIGANQKREMSLQDTIRLNEKDPAQKELVSHLKADLSRTQERLSMLEHASEKSQVQAFRNIYGHPKDARGKDEQFSDQSMAELRLKDRQRAGEKNLAIYHRSTIARGMDTKESYVVQPKKIKKDEEILIEEVL